METWERNENIKTYWWKYKGKQKYEIPIDGSISWKEIHKIPVESTWYKYLVKWKYEILIDGNQKDGNIEGKIETQTHTKYPFMEI